MCKPLELSTTPLRLPTARAAAACWNLLGVFALPLLSSPPLRWLPQSLRLVARVLKMCCWLFVRRVPISGAPASPPRMLHLMRLISAMASSLGRWTGSFVRMLTFPSPQGEFSAGIGLSASSVSASASASAAAGAGSSGWNMTMMCAMRGPAAAACSSEEALPARLAACAAAAAGSSASRGRLRGRFCALSEDDEEHWEADCDVAIACSNLRRAMATIAIALWPSQLRRPSAPRVHVLSWLQEMSCSADSLSISARNAPSRYMPALLAALQADGLQEGGAGRLFDMRDNQGNKDPFRRAADAFSEFGLWALDRPESVVVVGGHPLWFRSFVQAFLPGASRNAKSDEIVNGSAVAFTLSMSPSVPRLFRISPHDIHVAQ